MRSADKDPGKYFTAGKSLKARAAEIERDELNQGEQ
jgi:hypothetical protein